MPCTTGYFLSIYDEVCKRKHALFEQFLIQPLAHTNVPLPSGRYAYLVRSTRFSDVPSVMDPPGHLWPNGRQRKSKISPQDVRRTHPLLVMLVRSQQRASEGSANLPQPQMGAYEYRGLGRRRVPDFQPSILSNTLCKAFNITIEMVRGVFLSWPAPPLEWIGHTNTVTCMSCSPNGRQITSGPRDWTIRLVL